MSKILIAAYEFKHAEYYAREVLHIGRSAWNFIDDEFRVKGYRGMELIIINAPRHITTRYEREKRFRILETCRVCGVDIKEVALL